MRATRRKLLAGFSLIELMVSLAIGLIVTLAITGVLVRSESSKRSSTSLNDVNQTGAYITYVMDRAVRSAGSGFAQRWNESFGCRLNAAKSGAVILPRATALPAPFAAVPTSLRLAPVIIGKSQSDAGSDTLTVMAGNAGFGEAPVRVLTGSVTTTTIGLPNTLTFRGGDLVMVIEDGLGCMVQQVANGFVGTPAVLPNTAPANQILPIGGEYANPTGTDANLVQYGVSGTAYAVAMGNAANTSQFQVYGVGADRTLFSYDLLQLTASTAVPMADGVVAMRALYGVDTSGDGILDAWIDPVAGSPYASANLLSDTPAARQLMHNIISVKVGFILRSSLQEKDDVAGDSITLFSDLGATLTQTQSIAALDRKFRHRAVEVTVPLRNALMLF